MIAVGRRADAALALVALAGFLAALLAVDADPSPPFLAAGALGAAGFEAVALRYRDGVRRRWERPLVRPISLVAALLVAAVGAWIAPSRLLSAGIGALCGYLAILSLAEIRP